MPTKAARAPVEAYRHAHRLIFSKDIERRPVDLNVEVDVFLRPEVAELLTEVRRRGPLVEGPDGATFGGVALGEKLIDIDVGKIQNDLDRLLFVT